MSRVSDDQLEAMLARKSESFLLTLDQRMGMARELRAAREVVKAARIKRADPDNVQKEHDFDKVLTTYDATEDGE